MLTKTGTRQRRKVERPTEILNAAFEEFSSKGFAGTRLDDVASRAGITKGTIYLYFGGKEDLFIATLTEMTRPAFEHIAALTAAPSGPAMEILRAHMMFVGDLMVEDRRGREVIRMLMAEGTRFPNLVERWHVEVVAPICETMSAVIEYGIGRGEFRAAAFSNFPQIILAPIIMANNWFIMFGDRHAFDVRGFFEAAVDVLAFGLLTSSEPSRQE